METTTQPTIKLTKNKINDEQKQLFINIVNSINLDDYKFSTISSSFKLFDNKLSINEDKLNTVKNYLINRIDTFSIEFNKNNISIYDRIDLNKNNKRLLEVVINYNFNHKNEKYFNIIPSFFEKMFFILSSNYDKMSYRHQYDNFSFISENMKNCNTVSFNKEVVEVDIINLKNILFKSKDLNIIHNYENKEVDKIEFIGYPSLSIYLDIKENIIKIYSCNFKTYNEFVYNLNK